MDTRGRDVMKLFRQKDELFELMARSAAPRAGDEGEAGAAGAPAPGASGSSKKTTRTTARPGLTGATGGVAGAGAAGASASAGRPGPRPTTSVGRRPAGPGTSSAFSSPLGGPPIARPLGELVEIEGDALVVLDDDWEAAAPEPGRLLALRLDTAVVGGLLVTGLLGVAFLVGRTSSGPEAAAAGRPVAQAPVEASVPLVRQLALEAPPALSLPAAAPAASSAPPAGFRPGGPAPTAAATTPAAEAPARSAQKGKFDLRVVSTRAEKGADVARWFNENPRSPIFGRTDLEASAKDGHVRISGFTQREADVLARVKATTDPTGGAGTFHDAYWAPVR